MQQAKSWCLRLGIVRDRNRYRHVSARQKHWKAITFAKQNKTNPHIINSGKHLKALPIYF